MLGQRTKEAAVFLVAFAAAVGAEDDDSSVEAIKTACDEALWLDKVQGHYITKLTTGESRTTELSTEARQLTLAANRAVEKTTRAVLSGLAAIAASRSSAAERANKQATPMLLRAIAVLNERRGNVRALDRLLQTKVSAVMGSSATTAGTNTLFSATTVKCSLTADLDKKPSGACAVTPESTEKLAAAGHHLNKITKIKTTPLTAFAIPQLAVDIETKGTLTSGDTTADGSNKCADHATRASESKGVGLTKLALNKKTPAPTDNALIPTNSCVEATEEKDHYITTGSQVAHAICEIRGLTEKLPRKIADETADSLATDTNLQNAIYIALGKDANINDSTDQKAEKIKALLGGTGTKLQDKFFSTFNEENIKYTVGQQTVTTSVAKAASDSSYAITLAFLQQSQHGNSHSRECNRADESTDTTKENECSNTKDKDKCNEKNGCEFKDGECKAKVTTATGTDSKTNTTGNNSFVINKAPLWLAFLLF
uniref:Variable surface glycoprotein n=1 Tax=Trypanosoma evansi TaxID=5697 RepID=Q968L0_TRYEV|nr:variable surface glycoprotein [Trypanosoma evansi]